MSPTESKEQSQQVIPNVQFCDENFDSDFARPDLPNYDNIERLLLNLALNHAVLIERASSKNDQTKRSE